MASSSVFRASGSLPVSFSTFARLPSATDLSHSSSPACAGCIRRGNLLQTIERCAEVRLLVAEPGEELRAPGTKYVPPSLLELIEVVPGMVIAQRLGTG